MLSDEERDNLIDRLETLRHKMLGDGSQIFDGPEELEDAITLLEEVRDALQAVETED